MIEIRARIKVSGSIFKSLLFTYFKNCAIINSGGNNYGF